MYQEKTSNFVFFIDEGEKASKYQLVDLVDIPQEYLPEEDACLNIEE
jgi:hypothetical protein